MEECSKNSSSPDNKNLYPSNQSKEKQVESNTSILSNSFDNNNNFENVIQIEILLAYSAIGFKMIPLGADSKTPAIRSTTEICNNCTYWTTELIKTEHYRFKNIATTFGKTCIKDEKGEYLYLHGLDIDSDNVLRIVFDLLENLKSKTFVSKTKKDCGYHVYWLSHKQHPPVGTIKCKPGYEFEIKTDNSLGLCTLPPSRHRDDPNFRYHNVGQEKIGIEDDLYDNLISLLAGVCFIEYNPKNVLASNNNNNDYEDNIRHINPDGNGKTGHSDTVYRILEDEKIEEIISYVRASYQKAFRHDLIFGLSGFLFKNNISLPSATRLVSFLCDFSHDEEKDSRLNILSNTYSKGVNGQEVKGVTQLQEVLLRIHGSTKVIDEILEKVSEVLQAGERPISNDSTHPSSTQILVGLARQNTVLFFKDQYGVAYGRIRVSGHTEILSLESTKFEYYLSKLYYDLTAGEIVGQESLNNAKRVLIAETLFEAPIRELNLRVAWGERKGEEIYYDLANSEWQCIRI